LTGAVQSNPGRALGNRRPRSCAGDPERRRRTAAAQDGERRRDRGKGAGVHRWLRKIHQDDEHARANSTGASRSGNGEGRRRTARRGGGQAPAKANPAARSTRAPTNHTRRFLTGRRSWTAASRRRGNSDGGARARRPARVSALAAAGSGAARVSGERPQGCGRPLNRPGGGRIGVRARGQVHARRGVRLGVGSRPPIRLRPEVGDDGRGPPVGESGRAAAVWAGLGQNCGWAGLRRGLAFLFFFLSFFFQIQIFSKPNKLQTNSEFKPRFESNNQKQCTSMYATVNSYISLIN
jgi:hypothetical protein